METKIYFDVVDKSAWPIGPWNDEPDKMQWPDEATGMPCLIVRGPHGGLCGYVAVSDAHRFFGKGYDDVPFGDDYEHSPHGGLTFADECSPSATEERGICHVPAPGESDHVWWFGFDCAHWGDHCPKYNRVIADGDTYRTLAYVRAECARLASWLHSLTAA